MKALVHPVLVTGGAGYIGSHIAKTIEAAGFTPVAFGNYVRSQACGEMGAFGRGGFARSFAALDAVFRKYKMRR